MTESAKTDATTAGWRFWVLGAYRLHSRRPGGRPTRHEGGARHGSNADGHRHRIACRLPQPRLLSDPARAHPPGGVDPPKTARMYLWRQWQNGHNRFKELRRRGVSQFRAAVAAGSPTGCWRMSGHPAVQMALRNHVFDSLRLPRDPYARWCGRGDAVRRPPIPITAAKPSLLSPCEGGSRDVVDRGKNEASLLRLCL